MVKKVKELPDSYILSHPDDKDNKKYFYIGTSDAISIARHNIYKSGTVPTVLSDKEDMRLLKIGVTNNPDVRLGYHLEKIHDFRYVKVWKVRYAKTLESWILGENYKEGFSTFGSEWFWGTEAECADLLDQVDWLIENTFQELKTGYRLLYK